MYRVVSEEEKVMGEGTVSRKWRNWCQNEVDEETKGADSRDKVKHNGRTITKTFRFLQLWTNYF